MSNIYLLFLLTIVGVINGQTLLQIMEERSNLKMMAAWMSSDLRARLSNSSLSSTVFALNNDMFNKFFNEDDQLTNETIRDILSYHVGTTNITSDMIIEDTSVQSSAVGEPIIWFSSQNGDHYVNGVKVTTPDLVADNGVLHVIDAVLYPIGSPHTAKVFVEQTFMNFTHILSKSGGIDTDLDNKTKRFTLFVPEDAAISEELLNNNYTDEVVQTHVVDGTVLFWSRLMTGGANAMEGVIKASTLDSYKYVSSGGLWVKVKSGHGQSTSNGVVHTVNGVLGSTTTVKLLEVLGLDMLTTIRTKLINFADLKSKLESDQKYTVFAPEESAWTDVTADDKFLNRHVVMGSLVGDDLKGELTTLSDEKLMVKIENSKVYIEFNDVKAEIIDRDKMADNGVIHVIDKVLNAGPGVTFSSEVMLLSMVACVIVNI